MRGAGILLHVSSLPNKYGIGTFGKEAFQFVDFLFKTNQKYWQVLPLGPTSYGDSPYQTFSVFAGNPYFIDYELLVKDGLLKRSELQEYHNHDKVDYGYLFQTKFVILRKAFKRFIQNDQFKDFCKQNQLWLDDYALFMTIKESENFQSFDKWPDRYKYHQDEAIKEISEEKQEEITFWKFVQFIFYQQFANLKQYANQKGIKIIGDVPIYVAYDSSDVWGEVQNFSLDENLVMKEVAGVPPDAFSADGQLWGNPIYNYQEMEKDNYQWWIRRLKHSFQLYDIVRIDHFRGFVAYYSIPYQSTSAKNGRWIKGPGIALFEAIKKELGEVEIILEDLGYLTEDVKELRLQTNYPGMKVLQFAFTPDDDSDYLPHNHQENSVVYTGTHDNMTTKQWFDALSKKEKDFFKDYLNIKNDCDAVDAMIRTALSSVAKITIIPLQDYLELGEESRLNMPSKVAGNWQWRLKKEMITSEIIKRIKKYTSLYRRV